MQIAVNTRLLIKDRVDGISRYAYELLSRMTRAHPEDHFVFLFDREPDPAFIFSENVTPIVLSPQARHPFLFYWWFEFSVASLLNRMKPDVFFSPDGFLSLRANCKQVAVIHDINFAHFPEGLPKLVALYYNYFFPRFAKKADAIISVSSFSANDIIHTYGIDPAKVQAIHNGPGKVFPNTSGDVSKAILTKHCIQSPYFLFTGTLLPRKNIEGMLQAFDYFCEQSEQPYQLVMAGGKYRWTSSMENTYKKMKYADRVIFTGRVDDAVMGAFIQQASCMLFIPFYEGFGFPVLEAFSAGVPVVCSRVSSLPEVGGNYAFYCDPHLTDSIVKSMQEALASVRDREVYKKASAAFSWDVCAAKTYALILKTVHG
ncbi:MAG: glycosyltransferase family 4 protein [Bacteroidota bacterium]